MSALTLESSHPLALQGTILTDAAGYATLVDWYKRALAVKNKAVVLDLADLRWLDANQCALLGAMLHRLAETAGMSFCVDVDVVRHRFPTMLSNGFVQDHAGTWQGDGSTTSVQMQAFDITDVEGFERYVNECLLQQPDMGTSRGVEEQQKIVSHLLEVFTNVRKHAQTARHVFVCGQYYPNRKQLKFTLVDLGRGYLGPIQAFTTRPQYQQVGLPVLTAEQALRWALRNKNSSSLGRNGGLGLKTLRDYCIERDGELHLVSNGCYLIGRKGPGGQPIYNTSAVPLFDGSVAHMLFNCG